MFAFSFSSVRTTSTIGRPPGPSAMTSSFAFFQLVTDPLLTPR
jgi:hypothetical protein